MGTGGNWERSGPHTGGEDGKDHLEHELGHMGLGMDPTTYGGRGGVCRWW